jgi:hypothetical protein
LRIECRLLEIPRIALAIADRHIRATRSVRDSARRESLPRLAVTVTGRQRAIKR